MKTIPICRELLGIGRRVSANWRGEPPGAFQDAGFVDVMVMGELCVCDVAPECSAFVIDPDEPGVSIFRRTTGSLVTVIIGAKTFLEEENRPDFAEMEGLLAFIRGIQTNDDAVSTSLSYAFSSEGRMRCFSPVAALVPENWCLLSACILPEGISNSGRYLAKQVGVDELVPKDEVLPLIMSSSAPPPAASERIDVATTEVFERFQQRYPQLLESCGWLIDGPASGHLN